MITERKTPQIVYDVCSCPHQGYSFEAPDIEIAFISALLVYSDIYYPLRATMMVGVDGKVTLLDPLSTQGLDIPKLWSRRLTPDWARQRFGLSLKHVVDHAVGARPFAMHRALDSFRGVAGTFLPDVLEAERCFANKMRAELADKPGHATRLVELVDQYRCDEHDMGRRGTDDYGRTAWKLARQIEIKIEQLRAAPGFKGEDLHDAARLDTIPPV